MIGGADFLTVTLIDQLYLGGLDAPLPPGGRLGTRRLLGGPSVRSRGSPVLLARSPVFGTRGLPFGFAQLASRFEMRGLAGRNFL